MYDVGYETHNPVINLKTIVALQMIYFSRVLFLFAVLYPLYKYHKGRFRSFLKRSFKALKDTLLFSEILAIFFGCFLELMVAGMLY